MNTAARVLAGVAAIGTAFWVGTITAQNQSPRARAARPRQDRRSRTSRRFRLMRTSRSSLPGELNMRVATLFEGKELRVSIFESTPAKTDHRTRPTDVDEFVYVLSGKLILTEPTGTRHEFLPGDSLVLPIAYTGTWEMQGNYRELVVLAQK